MRKLSATWGVFACALTVGVSGFASAPARATVIGTETADGFTGPLFGPGSSTGYTVASDGETSFDPFVAGYDTSDGIQLNNDFSWSQASDSFWSPVTNPTGGPVNTWVLPANLTGFNCGSENEPTCEPVGHFISATPWNLGFSGTWEILESSDGGLSDVIVTFNDANGANILFYSDPIAAPEPSTLALLGAGLLGLGAVRRRRQTRT